MKDCVFIEIKNLLDHYPVLTICEADILKAFQMMRECYLSNGLIMTCGNGGSASDSSHIVGELMKGFKRKRPLTEEQRLQLETSFPGEGLALSEKLQRAIPAVSLVDQVALSSAFVNDVVPDMVYAQQVLGYGKAGDVLIGISTSGNSPNVINACKVAKAFKIGSIAFTGKEGGALSELCEITIKVPAKEVYRVQEYHLPIYHTLCAMLEAEVME